MKFKMFSKEKRGGGKYTRCAVGFMLRASSTNALGYIAAGPSRVEFLTTVLVTMFIDEDPKGSIRALK